MDETMSNEANLREAVEAAIASNFPPALQDAVYQFVFSELMQGMHVELAPGSMLSSELKQRDESCVTDRNYFRHSDAITAASILAEYVSEDTAAGACKMARDILNDCERAEELHRRIGYLAYRLMQLGAVPSDTPEFAVSRELKDLN